MTKILRLLAGSCLLLFASKDSQSQNIGIGVANPQQKLHIGGNLRIDGIANAGTGIITTNANGDLIRTNFSGNANEVLKGNGTFGVVPGSSIPKGSIIGASSPHDTNMISAGFSYLGELPLSYATVRKFSGGVSSQHLQIPTYEHGNPAAVPAPSPRIECSSAWTGSEMLIWGGFDVKADNDYRFFNDGARYNPSTDTWTKIATANAPQKRGYASTVWTGSELFVWGGYDSVNISLDQMYMRFTNTGGRYNAATNTWSSIPLLGAPFARAGAAAVWTGSLMVVWGGGRDTGSVHTGSRFNPSNNSWSAMSTTGAPLSDGINTKMFYDNGTGLVYVLGNGSTCARYNPVTNVWSSMPNVPSFYAKQNVVWTGSQIWIWSIDKIFKYTPATNSWSTVSIAGTLPTDHSTVRAVWTGFEMLFFGYSYDKDSNPNYGRFWRYDPGANIFNYADALYNQLVDQGCVLIAAGSMIIKWGGAATENIKGIITYRFSSEGLRYYITSGIAYSDGYLKSSHNNPLHLFKKD